MPATRTQLSREPTCSLYSREMTARNTSTIPSGYFGRNPLCGNNGNDYNRDVFNGCEWITYLKQRMEEA